MKKLLVFSLALFGIVNAVEQTLPEAGAIERATQPVKRVAPQYGNVVRNDGTINWEAVKQEGKRLAANWGLTSPETSTTDKEKAANTGKAVAAVESESCPSSDPNCW